MMNYLIISSKLLILVSDCLQAVRAGNKYFLEFILLQSFNVFLYQALGKEFISQPSCRIAVAFLFCSEYSVVGTGFFQQFYNAAGYILVSLVERPGTPDPVQNVKLFFIGCFRDINVFSPFQSL